MTPENWKKILNFLKRTGDRAIIADQETDEIFVLMSLSDYEQKIFSNSEVKGLTEDQLLDRINQDIAVWQATNNEEVSEDSSFYQDKVLNDLKVENTDVEDEERYYVEPSE